MNKHELADFLRGRRAALQPADVGIPERAGRPRRTPGLRREDVAWIAGVSINYYERLEQARGPRPSPQVLAALGDALRLSAPERAHLAVLAGHAPTASAGLPDVVPQGIAQLLDRMAPIAALVINAKHDILAWNAIAAELITDFAQLAAEDRNVLRLSLRGGLCDSPRPDEFATQAASDLRQVAARYPGDTEITRLINELTSGNADFAAGWRRHDVRAPKPMVKRVKHAEFGVLELDCQTLHIPGEEQRLVTYSAEPGTPAHEALERIWLGITMSRRAADHSSISAWVSSPLQSAAAPADTSASQVSNSPSEESSMRSSNRTSLP